MRIVSLLLAEHAWKKNNQISAFGIFHQLQAMELPFNATFRLIFRIEVDHQKGEDFDALTLTVKGPDGKQVGKATLQKEQPILPNDQANAGFLVAEDVVNFDGMPIDQIGRYEISLEIDGTSECATVSLDVIQA